jgi:hypothetical protein
MWFDIQTWLPLVTVTLAAAICLSVASFIMGSTKLPPCRGVTTGMVIVASVVADLPKTEAPAQSPRPQLGLLFGRLTWRNWRRRYETKHDPRM